MHFPVEGLHNNIYVVTQIIQIVKKKRNFRFIQIAVYPILSYAYDILNNLILKPILANLDYLDSRRYISYFFIF